MPKQLLTGTLEEQCAFLYDLAQQKMKAGNYTGAIHALAEILKYKPDYPGAAEMLHAARQGKRSVNLLLAFSFGGAILAIFLGTLWGLPNDFWFLLLALTGAVLGFLLGSLATGGRRTQPALSGRELPPQDTQE